VKWTINGSVVRHIVRFKPRDFGSDIEDAFYVDSGVTYDSTATTDITGLSHLLGETVAIFADGLVQTEKNVLPTPLAHWKLNETSGTALDNAEGTATYDGTLSVNASTVTSAGATANTGTSIDFGGAAYATVSDNDVFSFGDGTDDSPFSVSAWVYVTATANKQVIISKASAPSVGEWLLQLSPAETVQFYLVGGGYIRADSSALSLNAWNHIVATYDGSSSETGMNVYVNGVNDTVSQTEVGAYTAMTAGALDVIIGSESDGENKFQDKLDDVRIYAIELNANTVAALYNSGNGTQVTGDGDSITLDTAASTVQVGLPYTMKVRTMRHSLPQEGSTTQTRIKRITRTAIRFIRSLLGTAGQEYGGVEYLQPIGATYSTEAKDTPPNNRLAEGGFSEDAYTVIESSDPVPFTALASIIDVEIEK